jgi:tetratricopeptide (TPR) repeat protein
MPTRPHSPPNARAAATVLLVLALGCASYAPALTGAFQYDDARVVANAAIRDLGRFVGETLPRELFTDARPVTDLTFALDFAVAGLSPLAFHLTNLALHLVAVLLMLALGRVVVRRAGATGDGVALVTAALFALHPLQTEAVAYVSQRSEVLASVLYVTALLLLLDADARWPTRRGVASYTGALAAFAVGLATKQIVATVPAAYLLVLGCGRPKPEAAPGGRTALRRAAFVAPFLLAAAAAVVGLTRHVGGHVDVGFDIPGLGAGRYLLTQLRVIPTYLRLLAWPTGQNVDWDFPASDGSLDLSTALGGISLAALALASIALAVRARRRPDSPHAPTARLAAFGVLWFFLVLAPTSSVVPLADVLVEHRVYLASWGAFLAAAAGAAVVVGEGSRRRIGTALAALACVALAAGTFQRARAWRDPVALWTDAASKSPGKARVHGNLGLALARAGAPERALEEYRTALALPRAVNVLPEVILENMAAIHIGRGECDAAMPILREGLARAPRNPDLLSNTAVCRLQAGESSEAATYARLALASDAGHVYAHNTLGQALLRVGDLAGAASEFRIAARLRPDLEVPLRNLAVAQERLGDQGGACDAWRRFAVLTRDAEAAADVRQHIVELGCSGKR